MQREELVKLARESIGGINRPEDECSTAGRDCPLRLVNPASYDPPEWVLDAMRQAHAKGAAPCHAAKRVSGNMHKRSFTRAELEGMDLVEIASERLPRGENVTYVFPCDGTHWQAELVVRPDDGWEIDGDAVEAVEVRLASKRVSIWEPVP